MTTHHWQVGPAKCQSDDFCAYIVAVIEGHPAGWFYRKLDKGVQNKTVMIWNMSGSAELPWSSDLNLLPPEPLKLTREEVIEECLDAYLEAASCGERMLSMSAALDHYDKLRAEGRIE